MILAVVLALAAALSNAVNLMTQHLASVASPPGVTGVRLARYLVRQPMWLLGAVAGLGSYVLQAGALNNGPLSVVQPLLITELIFVMVLRRVWIHQQIRPAAWASVLTVAGALAVFLAAAEPTGGQPAPQAAQWLTAGVVFGGIIAPWRCSGSTGRRCAGPGLRAAAAAMTWAMEAVFLKTATETLTVSGPVAMLTSWPAYAFAAATATGTVLQQAALHVGPLSVSQPLLAIVDPLAAIVLSVWLFGERFTGSPADTAIAIVAFAVMAVGVTALTRTAPQELSRDEGARPRHAFPAAHPQALRRARSASSPACSRSISCWMSSSVMSRRQYTSHAFITRPKPHPAIGKIGQKNPWPSVTAQIVTRNVLTRTKTRT